MHTKFQEGIFFLENHGGNFKNLREIDCKDKRQGMHTELQEGIFFGKPWR
jgi:hypothetical protein